jgi:hypothetical protein
MVPSTSNRNVYFHEPNITSTGTNFPGATVLSTNGGADTLYWKVDANGMELLGLRGGTEGIAPYNNGALELKYPCTFGTTWTDAFSASLTVSGIPVTRAGTITGIADGYGTIQLPGVELNDVLRVKVRKIQIDQTPLGNLYRSYEIYYYYQEDVRFPLMKTSLDTLTVNNGTPSVSWTAEWLYGEGTTDIQDLNAGNVFFTPYPNPTSGLVEVRMEDSVPYGIEVLSPTGQLLQQVGTRAWGNAAPALDLSGLAAGVYQLRMTTIDGRQTTRRVVLH